MQGVQNVYTQHTPQLVQTLESLAKGKLPETDYPHIAPSPGQGMHCNVDSMDSMLHPAWQCMAMAKTKLLGADSPHIETYRVRPAAAQT